MFCVVNNFEIVWDKDETKMFNTFLKQFLVKSKCALFAVLDDFLKSIKTKNVFFLT